MRGADVTMMSMQAPGTPPLRAVTYVSDCLLDGAAADWFIDVGGILAASRRRNARLSVTGALLLNDTHFVQVLEGPSDGLEEVLTVIRQDPRHRILRMEETDLPARRFAAWSMAYLDREASGTAVLGPKHDFLAGSPAAPMLRTMEHLLDFATED